MDRLDDFFVVGGDSLLATAVVSQLRARLGRELPLRLLFDEPTVAGLAAAIEGGRFAQPTGTRRGQPAERLPLSRASNGCGPSVGPAASNGIAGGAGGTARSAGSGRLARRMTDVVERPKFCAPSTTPDAAGPVRVDRDRGTYRPATTTRSRCVWPSEPTPPDPHARGRTRSPCRATVRRSRSW
ncbi:hypothetical protein GS883_21830 [Rhodococcus hoagii]|nr:hypothetical protein [Prescottella equi]